MTGVEIDPNLFMSVMTSPSFNARKTISNNNYFQLELDLNANASPLIQQDLPQLQEQTLQSNYLDNRNSKVHPRSQSSPLIGSKFFHASKVPPESPPFLNALNDNTNTTTDINPFIVGFVNNSKNNGSSVNSSLILSETMMNSTNSVPRMISSNSTIPVSATGSGTTPITPIGPVSENLMDIKDSFNLMSFQSPTSPSQGQNYSAWGLPRVLPLTSNNVSSYGRISSIWNDSPSTQEDLGMQLYNMSSDQAFFSPFRGSRLVDDSLDMTTLSLLVLALQMNNTSFPTLRINQLPNVTSQSTNHGNQNIRLQNSQVQPQTHLQQSLQLSLDQKHLQLQLQQQMQVQLQHQQQRQLHLQQQMHQVLEMQFHTQSLPSQLQQQKHTNIYLNKVSNTQSFFPTLYNVNDKTSVTISLEATPENLLKTSQNVLVHLRVSLLSHDSISSVSKDIHDIVNNCNDDALLASKFDGKVSINLPKFSSCQINRQFNEYILSEDNMRKPYHEDYCSTFYKRNSHGYMFVKEPTTSLKVNSNGVGSKLWVQLKVNLPRQEASSRKLKVDVRELPNWWPATSNSSKPKRLRKRDQLGGEGQRGRKKTIPRHMKQ